MANSKQIKNRLSDKQASELTKILKSRFEKNMTRHKGIAWEKVQEKLEDNPGKLWSLNEMENSGGEPDVVAYDKKAGEFIFYDCAAESPNGRRSLCYDRKGLESRKEHHPENTAMDLAETMGVELLTETSTAIIGLSTIMINKNRSITVIAEDGSTKLPDIIGCFEPA